MTACSTGMPYSLSSSAVICADGPVAASGSLTRLGGRLRSAAPRLVCTRPGQMTDTLILDCLWVSS